MSSYYSKFGYVFGSSDIDSRLNIIEASVNDKVNGDVSSTDNAIVRWDGTTGKNTQNSTVRLNDTGDITGVDTLELNQLNGSATGILINAPTDHTNKDITNVNTIITTNLDTSTIGSSGVGGVVEFNDKPISNTAPTNGDDLTNKTYVDGELSGKVDGVASSANNRICVFDGITGKLIKQENITISGTLLEGFDDVGNPTRIEMGNDLYMFENDIGAVSDLGVDSITANTGSIITFNNKPQLSIAPTVNNDLTNKLYVDNRVGNLYCMIADGATVSDGDAETSLLASGAGDFVGTLTVPANGFAVGDAFHFVVAGDCDFDKDNEITLKLKNGGTLASITMDLEDTTGTTSWELEADFVIRSIGATGSIITNFDFTFNKKALKDFKGVRNVVVSSIDTTVSNTLDITAEFTVAPDPSSITAKMAYLKRMY